MAPVPEDRDPLWRQYEISVEELLRAFDEPNSVVSHNVNVAGRKSGVPRQIDISVKGTCAGIEIHVAVECKRRRRALTVPAVDEFVGKLLDIEADRGVLYAYGGFTSGAAARAANAANPHISAVSLVTPELVSELRGVPGYPADLMVQEFAPQWWDEMDTTAFRVFLESGHWSKYWW